MHVLNACIKSNNLHNTGWNFFFLTDNWNLIIQLCRCRSYLFVFQNVENVKNVCKEYDVYIYTSLSLVIELTMTMKYRAE